MPFKSDKQRKFMYAKHPEIAERWSKEEKRKRRDELIKELTKKRRKRK